MTAHHSGGHVEPHNARGHSVHPPLLVCQVGSTKLTYLLRAKDDLAGMLAEHGDLMESGAADEQKPAKEGTVEAWGRSDSNPVGGWYGQRKGCRGRFGMCCRRFSRSSVWSSLSTSPAATGCVRFNPDLPLASTPAPVA